MLLINYLIFSFFCWANQASQRERIKSMTLGDFAKYFDTPIEEAAKQLRLCATVIKKKLRSFNISRWPYRKVSTYVGIFI